MKKLILLCISSLVSTQALAVVTPLERSNFAAKVVSIGSGEVIYEHNSYMPLNPASTLKTLTFYLALKNLGEDFKFTTAVFASGRNLYIKFTGDPTLTMKDVDSLLASALKKTNSHIDTVYLDGDIFGTELYAPGSFTDNLKFYYASPISAFSIDKNYARFNQSPQGGLKYDNASMVDLLKLKSKAVATSKSDMCPLELFNTGVNEYTLDGCFSANEIPPKLSIAVTDPRKYARDLTLQLLKKYNVKAGKVEFGKVNTHATLLAEHKSVPLKIILKEMMYKSDNHIADSLVRYMTYKHFGKPATWFLVEKFLKSAVTQEFGVDESHFKIVDGAGLSKKNLINADFMITLLDRIYKDEDIRKVYFKSVPTIESEGSTLSKRFANSNFKGAIYAKTGTLDGVSGLTGIVVCDRLPVYSFSILTNNYLGAHNDMRVLEESVLEEIIFKAERM